MNRFRFPKGQALVELAIALPIVIVLIFGFLTFALVISEKQKLTHVANYAAQAGGLTNSDNAVAGAIEEFYNTGVNPSDGQRPVIYAVVSYDGNGTLIANASRRFNDVIKVGVEMSYPLPYRIPLASETLTTFSLRGEASSRILCNNIVAPFTCL